MSEALKIVIKKPIILKRKFISNEFVALTNGIRTDVLYRGDKNDLFNGRYRNLLIVNKFYLHNTIRTVASYSRNNRDFFLHSDEISSTIGNDKYALILKALQTVTDDKLRIEAILALLSDRNSAKSSNKLCQTTETSMSRKVKCQRRVRPNRCKAYVIDDSVAPETSVESKTTHIKKETMGKESPSSHSDDLLDLRLLLDDGSNMSCATEGNFSLRSCHIPNIPVLLENPISLLEQNTVEHTLSCNTPLKLIDGGTVTLVRKPEDFFHIASPDILMHLSDEDKKRVLVHQMYIDWKYCLQFDEDGNLPIHVAAMNNDTELLKRHCAILKSRDASVDVVGKESLTALQLSVLCSRPASVAALLRSGADVLRRDERTRSVLHLAAHAGVECVDVIVDFCKENARTILRDEEDLWKPKFEAKSDEELAQYLLDHLCSMFDENGYTALMLASLNGDHAIVSSLLAASPNSVNIKMPTCGNTALYLAFQTAFIEAEQSCNKKIIAQNYLEIIETLHQYGADPTITNNSGNSVTMLTADFKVNELSQAIASKLLKVTSAKKNFDSYMLVKNKDGDINVELVTPKKKDGNGCEKISGTCEDMFVTDKKCFKKTVVFFKPNANENKVLTQNVDIDVPKKDVSADKKIKIVNISDLTSAKTLSFSNIKINSPAPTAKIKTLPLNISRVTSKNCPIQIKKISPELLKKIPVNVSFAQTKPSNAITLNAAENSFNQNTKQNIIIDDNKNIKKPDSTDVQKDLKRLTNTDLIKVKRARK